MRNDYEAFRVIGAEIVVVVKDDTEAVREYFTRERLPYPAIADDDGTLADRFGQEWNLAKLGRMPAQFIIDCRGTAVFTHYGASMADIPANADMLAIFKTMTPCL